MPLIPEQSVPPVTIDVVPPIPEHTARLMDHLKLVVKKIETFDIYYSMDNSISCLKTQEYDWQIPLAFDTLLHDHNYPRPLATHLE